MPALTRSQTPEQSTQPAGPETTGPANTAQTPATTTVSRGGGTHVVKRGDTLWRIAQATYGSGRHWRDIANANPTRVFRNGDLILVGTELTLPNVEVEEAGGQTTTPPPTGGGAAPPPADSTPAGGTTQAAEPRGECTEFGDFMIYPDDYMGPLQPTGPDGIEHVRDSDKTRLVNERRAAAEAERAAALSSINELLSYSWNDWAITDSEATQALNLLGNLHVTQIAPAIGQMGQTNINRLLDNLPDNAKRTNAYCKVLVAMGPQKVMPYIQELLSYGLFDWAVTDGDVTAVMQVVNAMPPGQQAQVILGLPQSFQTRFAENLHPGAGISDDLLKQLFDQTPDDQIAALKALMGARFGIEIGERGSGAWTASALRQAWRLLELLPPGHVKDNEDLDLFLMGGATDGSGYYRGSDDSVVVESSDVTKNGSYGAVMVDNADGTRTDHGLHTNVNLFNTVVRHEIGHAVDANIGASRPGGYCATADAAGKWATFEDKSAFADAIISAGGGMSGHGYPDEDAYEKALRKAINDGTDFNTALKSLRDGSSFLGITFGQEAPATATDAPANIQGPVAAVYSLDRWHDSKNPWYSRDNRANVGGRVFQMAYSGSTYCSYTWSARQAHAVSAYQFRAPGEWFAEAYACYYSDHPQANGKEVGTALRTRDVATATWFDANVDHGYSLSQKAPTGADGGTGGTGTTPPAPAAGT